MPVEAFIERRFSEGSPNRLAPCPECGGDGGFEEAGSGKWAVCTFCNGTGEVETEAAEGLRDLEERCDAEERTDDLVERVQAAIDQLMACGNHIAIYRTDQWPAYELEGLTRNQQCENALRVLGATRDYDMWCCWSGMMQTRDAISSQTCTVTWERVARDRLRSLWLVVHAQGGRVSIERSVQEEYPGDDLAAVWTHTDPGSRDFIIEALRPKGDRE